MTLNAIARLLAARGIAAKVYAIFAFLVAFNIAAWALAFVAFAKHPILLGTALLAYTFGLRHAVDADHISAIDNVTRKLMQDHRQPVAVGFYFSLGHSSVVVALSIAIAIASSAIKGALPAMQSVGGVIGTSISAIFLLFIAAINIVVLADVVRAFGAVRRGEAYCDRTVDEMLDRRGIVGRFFRPLLKVVDRSWKMYPIGVLFGLGFDTATEVGLLGIAAVEASKALPVYDILIFPLLFTAGMSLLDTADGVLMLAAYGWAVVKPIRKLYYNLTVTLVSVVVALLVGAIEAAGVFATQLRLEGGLWSLVGSLGSELGTLGFVVAGIFIAAWIISVAIYRVKRYDDLEVSTVRASIDLSS